MPRPRHYSDRPRDDKRWRCHKCGAKNGLEAIRVERDEDYNRLRLRRCRHCKEVLATEETVITLDQFYARATTRKEQGHAQWLALKAQRHRKNLRTCKRCNGQYRLGHYSKHTLEPDHLAVLKLNRSGHQRERARRNAIRAYWRKRGVNLDTATSAFALADLTTHARDRLIPRLEDIREDVPA